MAGRATQRQVLDFLEGARLAVHSSEPISEPGDVLLVPSEIPTTFEGPPRTSTSFPIQRDPLPASGKVLTRELAGHEALASGRTEKWMNYAMHKFPTSSAETNVEEMETRAGTCQTYN